MEQRTLTDNDWVVILTDPSASSYRLSEDTSIIISDYWSPWNVHASTREDAVARAIADWWEWLGLDKYDDADEVPPPPKVLKIYRCSALGHRAD